jgi:hypothetical protein
MMNSLLVQDGIGRMLADLEQDAWERAREERARGDEERAERYKLEACRLHDRLQRHTAGLAVQQLSIH